MGWLRRIWLVMIVFTGGCAPSMEAKSAGEIGCTPEDIVISNEKNHFGLIQSGKTWVAECQGRTYVCSQINESGNDKDIFDALFASEQVSCHEAPESPQAERNRRAEEAALAERANRPPSTAPSGGESLDMSVGKSDDKESAAIRLVYRRPANAANASAL